MPVLIRHLLAGAQALKPAVCSTLALFLRTFNTEEEKIIAIKSVRKLAADVGMSKSAAGRIAYVDLCEQMISRFSTLFFQTYLLPTLVSLRQDPVSNVRIRLAKSVTLLQRIPKFTEMVNVHLVKPLSADPDGDVRAVVAAANGAPCDFEFDEKKDATMQASEGNIASPALMERVAASEHQDKEREAELLKKEKKRSRNPRSPTTTGLRPSSSLNSSQTAPPVVSSGPSSARKSSRHSSRNSSFVQQ